MAVYTLFGQPAAPATGVSDAGAYTFGVQFSVSQSVPLTAIWFYSAPGFTVLPGTIALYAVSGGSLVHSESASWSGAAGSGWVRAPFSSPPSLASSTSYKGAVLYTGGSNWYSATAHYWDSGPGAGGITSGPLSAPNNAGGDGGQDTFNSGSSLTYPSGSFNAGTYWLDVEVTGGTVHNATASLTVTPSFSAARTRGKYRTGALTVTPSFSAARTRGTHRTASLTVTPSLLAHGINRRGATAVFATGPARWNWTAGGARNS